MAREFKLPDLGEGVKEGQVIKLFVKAGDSVREDQPLMEVETDKAAVEIPSPVTGTVTSVLVKERQIVNVGDVMIEFAPGSDGASDGNAAKSHATSKSQQQARGGTATATLRATTSAPGGRSPAQRAPASPAVRKLARQLGVNIDSVRGSGPGGRVQRSDVEAAAGSVGTGGMTTMPSVRATGPRPPVTVAEPAGVDDADQWGPIRRHPLSQARKTIANVMTQAWTTIPHVTDSDDADVTELEKLRKGYPSPENSDRKITMLAFVVRAVARALQMHPEFNAAFDAERSEIIYRRYINIAVGVHTQRGLVAPVIRNTETLGVLEIADALDRIIDKARTASFEVNETRGGTYTISNAGAFGGSHYSTPIVTPGQCAVLAIGRSRMRPWIIDGEITPRLIMPLSHSFDHRLADGGQEIAFLQQVIASLENPARMLL